MADFFFFFFTGSRVCGAKGELCSDVMAGTKRSFYTSAHRLFSYTDEDARTLL